MGLDSGDRQSHYCLTDEAGEVAQRGTVATTDPGLTRWAAGMPAMRFVMEAGTHSPWVRRLLMGGGSKLALVESPTQPGGRQSFA